MTKELVVGYRCEGHCKRYEIIELRLNDCLRKVTGLVKSTPLDWLPILAYIELADLRRKKRTQNMWQKIDSNKFLPIHQDLASLPTLNLKDLGKTRQHYHFRSMARQLGQRH